MLFDQNFLIHPDPDNGYEKKLLSREKSIAVRMQRRYGDKGFILNNLSTYWAFRVVKIVTHLISISLAFTFVIDLLVNAFTDFTLKELIHQQASNPHQEIIGLGLFLISIILYGAIEYLKSIGIAAAFFGYYKPKINKKRFQWGWIMLTFCMLAFSIFASYQGGKITPGLFDKGVDQTELVDFESQAAEYYKQIDELSEQRNQLTTGLLGYRYGWLSPQTQHFELNSRGQRKLDQIDEELQKLRSRVLEIEKTTSAHNTRAMSAHTDTVNRNGTYMAMISLLMEMLIVISGAWLVWYGVKVEYLLISGASKREYPILSSTDNATSGLNGEKIDSLPQPEINETHLPDKSFHERKMIIHQIFKQLKAAGIKPTWRKILEAIPQQEDLYFNEYSVRRYLTEIRKMEKLKASES